MPAKTGTSLVSIDFSDDKSTSSSTDRSAGVRDEGEFPRHSLMSALAPRARKVNDISGFTIDKLKFASLGLHGRDKELELLTDILDKVVSGTSLSNQERQLVLISGYSGTGKTALVNHALKKSTEKLGGLLVRGKFDLHLRNQPYSAISAACAEICGAIVALQIRDPCRSEDLCRQITTELGSELALLIQIIPVLAEVVTLEVETPPSQTNTRSRSRTSFSSSSADSKNQINFAFLRFIRVISYQFTPLVFVLDDLQWADVASLDLLEALLMDAISTSKLLVVGIYRSNEVDETHIFHHAMKELETKSKDKYFELTQLEIGNLEVDAVNTILQELLGMDDADLTRTWGLADVCHRKTLGNVFFFLHFVSMLKERQMLQFNFGTVSWTWDEKKIEASTTASDNVVNLLKAKMWELPEDLVHLLKIASCLGSTFEGRILKLVWEASSADRDVQNNVDTLSAKVARLVAFGYLVTTESKSSQQKSCSWSHDKVQEAATSLVPETEQAELAANVGRILLSHLNDKELDSAIFVVANLLNGNVDVHLDKWRGSRLDLAELNCRASQKAILCSAFDSAAGYVAKGIQWLPGKAWANHYELSLNLHTIGAKAEGVLGNTETMEKYCRQVISQASRPMEDKLGVYHTWIDSVLNRVLFDEARDLALEILGKFGCHFSNNPAVVGLKVVHGILRIKATLQSRDASKLPMMTDPTRIELMNLLGKIGTIFYMMNDHRLPLCTFKALDWTMKYGYCDYSSVVFASIGMILTGILNDLPGGAKYCEQALILLDRSTSQSTAARTMFITHGLVFSYTKPLRSLLNQLLIGYDVGLQNGDTESATWLICMWLNYKHIIGSSLEGLESDSFLYLKQMKALKRDQAGYITQSWRQVYLNLLGLDNADNPTCFSGDSLREEELERYRDHFFFGPLFLAQHGILLTYFGEYVQHADRVIKVGHDHLEKSHVSSSYNLWDTFIKGISCLAAAQETRKRKYVKMGQIFRSKIHKWIDMGNPNVKHYGMLLDAEWTAFKGKNNDAIKQYEGAIFLAARGGYQHDAALATERFGMFYLRVMGDREDAAYQIGQSIKYWQDWGAVAKVRHLEEKYADLLPKKPT